MKRIIAFLLMFVPFVCVAQNLIRCNDSTFYFVSQKENYYAYLKLSGKIGDSGNPRVIEYNNKALQAMLINKQKYLSRGDDDTSILSEYVLGEMNYFTNLFQTKLQVTMVPGQLLTGQKVLIWYFDLPESQLETNDGKQITEPAMKQVSISMISEGYIYSIGTTQFKYQSLDELTTLLTRLITTVRFSHEPIDANTLCGN